jgi:predicted nucleotide-binding protein
MTSERKHLFVSYAQEDAEIVSQFVAQLRYLLRQRQTPVDIWMDRQALTPGADWQKSIEEAIRTSVGVLIFLSPASARSEWVARQIEAAAAEQEPLIIPVLLGERFPRELLPSGLPSELLPSGLPSELNFIRIAPTDLEMAQAASRVAQVIDNWLRQHPHPPPPLVAPEAKKFAEEAAESVRAAIGRQTEDDQAPPDSVFVVHGHDEDALRDVCDVLSGFGVRPVVLSRIEGPVQSLLQKFFSTSKEARFAIVILTSDDYGASRVQYEAKGVADRALQFRARQNVILELGFFYGYLGWEKVFVLLKKPGEVFPNFERPSDLDGAVFDPIDERGRWKTVLAEKLRDAGFHLRQTTAQ